MLTGLFESPFFDVLIIILLLRWFVPSLFRVRPVEKEKPQKEKVTINSSGDRQQKFSKEDGEYIDYEEVK